MSTSSSKSERPDASGKSTDSTHSTTNTSATSSEQGTAETTSTDTGNPTAATQLTATATRSPDVHPALDGPCIITDNWAPDEPGVEGPTDLHAGEDEDRVDPGVMGGGGNKKGPHQEITFITGFSTKTGVVDGIARPYTKVVTINFKVMDGFPQPDHYRFFRDNREVPLLSFNSFQDFNWIPGDTYTYRAEAMTAQNELIAKGTYVMTMPLISDLHKILTKVLVIPMRMKDCDLPQASQTNLENSIINDSDSVLSALNEMSFGKVNFTLDFYEEVPLPKTVHEYANIVDDEGQGFDPKEVFYDDVENWVIQEGPWEEYDFFYLSVAGYGPVAAIGGEFIYINPKSDDNKPALLHESTHFFGLYHSATWECGEELIAPTIELPFQGENYNYLTYGDVFCPVGGGSGPVRHMSALKKLMCGWIHPDQVEEVTAENIYNLYPVQQPGNNLVMLRIPFPGVNNKICYVVEYSAPIGIDAAPLSDTQAAKLGDVIPEGEPLDAVFVRLRYDRSSAGQPNDITEDTFLIKQAVIPGNPFVDNYRNITVELLSYENGYVRVRVSGSLVGG